MLHDILKGKKVILASSSPRRKEILNLLRLKFLVLPATIDEIMDDTPPYIQVKKHAMNKVLTVANKTDTDAFIIGADTIVYLDGKILGKPIDERAAKEYLLLLSGKKHTVYTGVAIKYYHKMLVQVEKSIVWFQSLSNKEIDSYIRTREPFDKAGAYGIQGYGSQFIKKINGCYFNVMGFPVHLFYKMVKQLLSIDENSRLL